jgi:signal transduction histidine kinase/CheY-like chemotaxis protein/HPt (histidine-containing phosphotransfer) domain-containing protein
MRALARHLERRFNLLALIGGVLGAFLVGWVDYVTGEEISFSIFYLIPVSLVAWQVGARCGVLISLLSGTAWYMADVLGHPPYSHPAIPVWNAAMRTMIFIIVSCLLGRLKNTLCREREARLEAAKATNAKSQFLAIMSHEIRTSLNAIMGVAELLAGSPLNGPQKQYVEILRSEEEHLRRLINDILDFSKLEAGRIQLEEADFQLRDLVRGLEEAMRSRAQEKGLTLVAEVAPELPDWWRGDPYRLRQILLNLLSNALKFTNKGQVSLGIRAATAEVAAGQVQFSVTDTGIGIAADQHARLFQNFTQTDSSVTRLYGGSGLGLSISKGLVELMGGRIWLESRPGKGTTSSFTVPLKPPATGGVSPVALPCRAPAIAPAARPLRVLLVEDDRVNQVIVCQFLKDTNCQVETAENGRVALAKFEKGAYDLVLMDMRMPEMDGLTATRLMRAWEREHGRPATPIVALTASALAEDRAQCLAAGCANFVAKPLRKAELLAVIQQAANTPLQAAMGAGKPGRPPRVRVDAEVLPLIPAFMAEMRQLLEAIRTALAANDYGTVGNIAHQITGVGGSYGFEELSVLARSLEGAAKERDRAQVHGLVLACADYLEKVEVAHD